LEVENMSKPTRAARRERADRSIYRRTNAAGRIVFEVVYRDSSGRQRWTTVDGGITAARAVRDDILGRKGKGERVQPNPRLRFGDAAEKWLGEQVEQLRPATQASYHNSVEVHLRPRWERRRLDSITVDDAATLVRELRAEGKAEWTVSTILQAASRVFKFAQRRMNWFGENPVSLLEASERARTSSTPRRRIYAGDELGQTLAGAHEPYRTLFSLAAVTGARLSEVLGLRWADVDLQDTDAAEVRIAAQVDRRGVRRPLKTEESRRTVEIPRQVAMMLARHKLASPTSTADAFVFATRSGRPLGQRNVGRALRNAQRRAVDSAGRPTFPVLHETDERGEWIPVPHGAVPNFHSFRHSAASEAIAAGDSAEEVSWQLGHRNSIVTRTVYVQEIRSAERTARRRAKMEARYADSLAALDTERPPADAENVVVLSMDNTGR